MIFEKQEEEGSAVRGRSGLQPPLLLAGLARARRYSTPADAMMGAMDLAGRAIAVAQAKMRSNAAADAEAQARETYGRCV